MRLARFIEENRAAISEQWVAFARTLYPASQGMTRLQLQNHLGQILTAVVKDLSTPQTKPEQSEKSMGRAPTVLAAPATAAETHAVLRAQSGMNVRHLVAEYRALRASVVRLWEAAAPLTAENIQDLIRFNEAIDQAVAESIAFFDDFVERARSLLIGTLVHDMRTPLNAIAVTAAILPNLERGDETAAASASLLRGMHSIKTLVDDLLDFSRTSMREGLSLHAAPTDFALQLEEELQVHRAAHPGRRFEVTVQGDTVGHWDPKRLRQLVRNLVSNACLYGAVGEPVQVRLDGTGAEIRFAVKNRGDLDAATAERLFNPLARDQDASQAHPEGHGLGLFIVREVARAHGGDVEMRSAEGEVEFTVWLPRGG